MELDYCIDALELIAENIKNDSANLLNSKIKVKYKNKEAFIEPLFTEGYRYEKNGIFQDCFCHKNDEQKNRKEKLYVHKKTAQCARGIDLVLSDTDDVFYSILLKVCYVYINNNTYLCSIAFLPSLLAESFEMKLEDLKEKINNGDEFDCCIERKERIEDYFCCRRNNLNRNKTNQDVLETLFKYYQNLEIGTYIKGIILEDNSIKAYKKFKDKMYKNHDKGVVVVNRKYFE